MGVTASLHILECKPAPACVIIKNGGDKLSRAFYLNPQLYNKLYAVMQYENALALRVSLETGIRIDDVLHLQKKQLQGRTITYTAMKTGKSDKKVVSVDLAKRLRQVAGKKWIFTGRFGKKPRTRQAVWKDVKKSARVLKLDGNITPHSARKTYAVEDFKDNGLKQVQKDLQHDNVNTTMLYAFADLIDKKQACSIDVCGVANEPTGEIIATEHIEELADKIAKKVADKLLEAFG